MDVHGENAREQEDVKPEGMDNIQWLKAKYENLLERERKLLEYVIKTLEDFDYRIKVIESELKKG